MPITSTPSRVTAWWISLTRSFSSDDTAPGFCPVCSADSTRSSVISSVSISTSISDIRTAISGSSMARPVASDSARSETVLQRVAQLGRGDAGAALEFEQVLAVGPALAFLADAVGDGHADVVEEHLVDLVVAADGQDRPRW